MSNIVPLFDLFSSNMKLKHFQEESIFSIFDNLTAGWSKCTLFNLLTKHTKAQASQVFLRRIFVQKVAECELEVLPKQMERMLKAEEYTQIMDKFILFQSER